MWQINSLYQSCGMMGRYLKLAIFKPDKILANPLTPWTLITTAHNPLVRHLSHKSPQDSHPHIPPCTLLYFTTPQIVNWKCMQTCVICGWLTIASSVSNHFLDNVSLEQLAKSSLILSILSTALSTNVHLPLHCLRDTIVYGIHMPTKCQRENTLFPKTCKDLIKVVKSLIQTVPPTI